MNVVWLPFDFVVLLVSIYLWLYSPCGPWPLFQFLNPHVVGRTPWTGDQPVAKPLPTHRTIQTQNKRTRHPRLSGTRTNDLSAQEGEDGLCLRPRGHCGRRHGITLGNCSATLARLWYLGRPPACLMLCLFGMLSKYFL
jgi:hypothetical protein